MFAKPTVLILGPNYLEFLSKRLDFPPEVVANLEVIDTLRFAELLDSFLVQAKNAGKVVVSLSTDVVFPKTFEGKYSLAMEESIKDFLNNAPILPEKIARKIVTEGNSGFSVWVTNRELYAAVVSALIKRGLTVVAVVPQNGDYSKEYLVTRNFLMGKNELTWHSGKFNKKRLAAIAGIAIVVAGAILAVRYPRSALEIPTPVAKGPKVQIEEPKMVFKEIKNIKVSVLNGTGAPGMAGKAAKILEGLGYAGVTTGNAKSQNEVETKITTTAEVSPADVSQIKGELEKVFEKVVLVATPSASMDIMVVTGR